MGFGADCPAAGQLLREVGLHPGQERVMMELWDHGARWLSDLVRMLESDAATMTRTIQRLEHAGFVRRRPCATDRRAVLVESTPAGIAVRGQVEALWAEPEAATRGDMAPGDRATVVALLERTEANLSARLATRSR
ncbi:MarR family winged helix-turn-helix transcriptional regulator [Cellulomonas hominis]